MLRKLNHEAKQETLAQRIRLAAEARQLFFQISRPAAILNALIRESQWVKPLDQGVPGQTQQTTKQNKT